MAEAISTSTLLDNNNIVQLWYNTCDTPELPFHYISIPNTVYIKFDVWLLLEHHILNRKRMKKRGLLSRILLLILLSIIAHMKK